MILLENLILMKSCLHFFLNFNSMFYAIYADKFSLSSTNATKNIYINLEIPKVAEIIDKYIYLKFIITKSLINSIYYLTKCH